MGGIALTPGISEGGAIILAIVALLTALVTVFGGHVVRVIGGMSRSIKAVREQVENSHTTNLRDESDERHSDNSTKLDRILKWAERVDGRMDRMDTRLQRIEGRSDAHDARIEDIEDTQNPRRSRT